MQNASHSIDQVRLHMHNQIICDKNRKCPRKELFRLDDEVLDEFITFAKKTKIPLHKGPEDPRPLEYDMPLDRRCKSLPPSVIHRIREDNRVHFQHFPPETVHGSDSDHDRSSDSDYIPSGKRIIRMIASQTKSRTRNLTITTRIIMNRMTMMSGGLLTLMRWHIILRR